MYRELKVALPGLTSKGKGSVCAFTESILRHSGVKTGMYTSPHLVSIRERIQVEGVPVEKEEFSNAFWFIWENLSSKVGNHWIFTK